MKCFYKYITLGLLPASFLTACIQEESFQKEDMSIKIEAQVGSPVLSTKSVDSPGIDYDYQDELNINLIRWDQASGNGSAYGKPTIKGIMRQPAQDGSWRRKIDFAAGHTQFYASRTDEVGFAAWYPDESAAGWVKENESVILKDNTMRYNIDGKTDVMVSDMHKGTFESGLAPLKFRHALCLFNIYAYAVDKETRLEWGKLNQVAMQNLPEQLIINLPADMNAGTAEFMYGKSAKEYTLLPEGTAQELHAGVPDKNKCHISTMIAGVPNSKRISIKVVTENQKEGNTISIVRDFKPGYAYNIFLRLSTRGIVNAEVTTGDWVYDGNDYIVEEDFSLMSNLSRYGTANCYIVSSGNRGYSFDATVKGNGVNTISMESGKTVTFPDKDVNITGVDSVGILRSDAMMKLVNGEWEFIEDINERRNTPLIELISDNLSLGRVLFKTIGDSANPQSSLLQYKGNVKIGVFSKGKVLWSWHIWITDIPKSQGYSNGYVALDRNLGAVTTDYKGFRPGYSHWSGFYYQFGRKDPIYRATVDASFGAEKRVIEHPVPVAEAHSNPMNYYYDKSGNSNNWTTDENSEYYWGYKSVREDVVKTMYDPCPPGYRVPGTGLFEQSDASVQITKVTNSSNYPAGYLFNIGSFVEVYYPNTICIAEGEVQNCDLKHLHNESEDNVFLSVATPYDPTLYDKPGEIEGGAISPAYRNLAWHFRYHGESLTNVVNTIVSDPEKYHTKRSAAFPVRCVLEDSSPKVTDLSEFQTANSYIVPSTGFYKFNATKRGNGVTGLNVVSNNGTTTYRTFDAGMGASITGIDRVEVLWWQGDLTPGSDYMKFAATNPTSEEIEAKCPVRIVDKGRLRNGNVAFMASSNDNTWGNVGLAAYDQNNKILWTWHIWIQPGVNVVNLGKYTIMDRNLGATYAPEGGNNANFDPDKLEANIGFYYQWGRKDPFFTSSDRKASQGSGTTPWFYKDVNTRKWVQRSSFTSSQSGTIQESVERPLDFFRQNNPPGIWHTTYGASADSPANDFWGYVGIAGSIGESFAKTMYDPCPPGYKVMQHNVFESANICEANNSKSYQLNGYEYTSKETNIYNKDYGIYLHNGLSAMGNIESTGVWFPNSGYINSDGDFKLNNEDPVARVSTATPFSNGNILNCREMRWVRHSEREGFIWDRYDRYTYRFSQNNDTSMADARVVRCQME